MFPDHNKRCRPLAAAHLLPPSAPACTHFGGTYRAVVWLRLICFVWFNLGVICKPTLAGCTVIYTQTCRNPGHHGCLLRGSLLTQIRLYMTSRDSSIAVSAGALDMKPSYCLSLLSPSYCFPLIVPWTSCCLMPSHCLLIAPSSLHCLFIAFPSPSFCFSTAYHYLAV